MKLGASLLTTRNLRAQLVSATKFLILAALALGALTNCGSLPPDLVTAANYDRVAAGMTKEQVFAILGPGVQQSESTVGGMRLENYVWQPRADYRGAEILVTFNNGYEMSKMKVGL